MTENEYALKIIGGIQPYLTGKNWRYFGEVPRHSHNDHADLLIINKRTGTLFVIEFKLIGELNLLSQVHRYKKIPSIGILKKDFSPSMKKIMSLPCSGTRRRLTHFGYRNEWYSYIGMKDKLMSIDDPGYKDKVSKLALKIRYNRRTYDQCSCKGFLYWYGYYFSDSDYANVGTNGGERFTLYQLYRRAVKNLFTIEGHPISYDLVSEIFGHYSESTGKSHYRAARKEWESSQVNKEET